MAGDLVTSPRDGTAGELVRAHVAAQVALLVDLEPRVRAGEDEAVHDARTAARRLRTVLHVFRDVAGDDARRTREPLHTLGRLLGAARDPAVELAAVRERAAGDERALVVGPVLGRVTRDRTAARRRALTALRRHLDSPEWQDLLTHLRRLATETPTGELAPRPARRVARERVRERWHRMLDAHDDAVTRPPGPERDAALHLARRRARQARHTAEAARPAVGGTARRAARRAHAVQDLLGTWHDAVLRAQVLRATARAAHTAGESTFTYGRWHVLDTLEAREAEAAAAHAVRRARRSKPGRRLA